jgi:hypothetical protein
MRIDSAMAFGQLWRSFVQAALICAALLAGGAPDPAPAEYFEVAPASSSVLSPRQVCFVASRPLRELSIRQRLLARAPLVRRPQTRASLGRRPLYLTHRALLL